MQTLLQQTPCTTGRFPINPFGLNWAPLEAAWFDDKVPAKKDAVFSGFEKVLEALMADTLYIYIYLIYTYRHTQIYIYI